eukprot:scaffold44176_cov61-Phaeocystis_antarctica.AAC.3
MSSAVATVTPCSRPLYTPALARLAGRCVHPAGGAGRPAPRPSGASPHPADAASPPAACTLPRECEAARPRGRGTPAAVATVPCASPSRTSRTQASICVREGCGKTRDNNFLDNYFLIVKLY